MNVFLSHEGVSTIKIAICDTEQADRNYIIKCLYQYFGSFHEDISYQEFVDDYELTQYTNTTEVLFDLYIINLECSSSEGLVLVRTMKSRSTDAVIIFTSSSGEYALEAYQLLVEGYLLKPYNYKNLKAYLDKYIKPKLSQLRELCFKHQRLDISIPLEEIFYIEVFNKKCCIHTKERQYESYTPLAQLIKKINNNNFYRCHKSYYINMNHISKNNNTCFELTNESIVPFSKRDKNLILSHYHSWLNKS